MNKKPIKVLYFVDRMLRGGIQSLVIDWVSKFDKKTIQVDFLLLDDGKKYELEDTLNQLGCNVYKLNGIWINKPLDFFKEAKALDTFFKEHHDYTIVHMHSTSKNYMVLKYAKKYGIPMRITHAHASDFQTGSKIKKIIGSILKPKLIKYSTDFFACSKEAGKWLFGNKIANSTRFSVIKNGVDYDKYKFNNNYRLKIRKKYNVKETDVLIGHIGRFTEVKNHDFMISLINKLVKQNSNYKIMFVGEGILEEKIKNEVIELNLQNNVIFAGYQPDVSMYLSAFDLFILPSKYEGLGLVLIEAQANGLKCIATKGKIPAEVKINNNFAFCDLMIDDWTREIERCSKRRISSKEKIKQAGFLNSDTVEFLQKYYVK